MLTRLSLFFRHITYNLRGGFLVRPLIIALALGATGIVLSTLEEKMPAFSDWVPRWLFPSHYDPQVAQLILGDIATSVMTVVSIVFAILLMSLTLASMQFSPRIVSTFAQDRATQWTLGIFLGTFSYCIAALPAAHNYPTRFEPVVTVAGGMFLALVCVAWLLFFIHHISQAIGVNHIVENIARDTLAVIDQIMPRPGPGFPEVLTQPEIETGDNVPVVSRVSGYIRYVDLEKLKAVAKQHRVAVHVLRRFGHYVPAGVPLVSVTKEHKLSSELTDGLLAAFDIGPSRTMQQDIEYGVLQIVDIALKAISPAVNDPTTAITCIDQLSRILIYFAGRQPLEHCLYDPPGVVRVIVPPLRLDRLIDSAFEQIRMYAKGDVAVSLRLLRAFGDLASVVADPAIRSLLSIRANRVYAGASERLSEEELVELRVRLEALEKTLVD